LKDLILRVKVKARIIQKPSPALFTGEVAHLVEHYVLK